MDLAKDKGVKRKLDSEQIENKRLRTNENGEDDKLTTNILHLSDCTLMYILKLLDIDSLHNLSETCERFNCLVQDESLWMDVDGRRLPTTWGRNRFIWKSVHKDTKTILLAANQTIDVIISIEKLIISKMFSRLTILALEHQCIKYCRLSDFPNTLVELSLRWSFVPRDDDFFRFGLKAMSQLKTLLLDHCKWLEANSFMSICRFPKLEILSVYMCKKLSDNDVSNLSIAGTLGFKSLKVVDLRFSGLGDVFIRTFYSNPNIQIIYFQNFPATYYMERWQRKLDIIGGEQIDECGYVSDDDENNNVLKSVLQSRFGVSDFVRHDTQNIRHSTITFLNRLVPNYDVKVRPTSVLYKYPYSDCTCGFEAHKSALLRKSNAETSGESNQHTHFIAWRDDVSNYECPNKPNCWDKTCLMKKVRIEIKKQIKHRRYTDIAPVDSYSWYFLKTQSDICTASVTTDSCAAPLWCHEEATPNHIVPNWIYKREPRSEFEIELLNHTEKSLRLINHMRCCGCKSGNVIVLQSNCQGCLEEIQPVPPHTNRATVVAVKDCDVASAINRMVDFMGWLKKHNQNVDTERVVQGFNKCINIEQLLAPADDRTEFVSQLACLLLELSKIKQDMYYVLSYHGYCLKDCMMELLTTKTVEEKKEFLLYFFKNMVHSEQIGSDNLPEPVNDNSVPESITDFELTFGKDSYNCRFVPKMYTSIQTPKVTPPNNVTNISELSFRGFYSITDLALPTLSDLHLDLLDVTGTNVTPNGVWDFLNTNPNCRVVHESACICRPKLHF